MSAPLYDPLQHAPLPGSIREINDLSENERFAIYRQLLPDWLLAQYAIDPETYQFEGKSVVQLRGIPGTRALELTVRRRASDIDPMLYLNMADTFNQQLLVLLVVVNDPDAIRYNIDRDMDGNLTHFGTSTRNLPAEEAAMTAGLAPGQVRAGLRVFKQLVPLFEQFIARMGQRLFFIEPLAYHNAVVFERYGFHYVRGYQEMVDIHRAFQPGGGLHARLSDTQPFRPRDAWNRIRGRSWAIHDGILGHPFTGFQMYKEIGRVADVESFPDAVW